MNKHLIRHKFHLQAFETLGKLQFECNDPALVSDLKAYMKKELQEAYELYAEYPNQFYDLESQVHELRRKLRWMSIYAESLQGLVLLKRPSAPYSWEQKFLPKQSRSSFNRIPHKKGLSAYIVFDRDAFYALNKLVEVLGAIKDKGLLIDATSGAIKKLSHKAEESTLTSATEQLGLSARPEDLLNDAHKVLHDFFVRYSIHQKLLPP